MIRTLENEEHTKEESRTLCSDFVVIGNYPPNAFGLCSVDCIFSF